MHHSHDSGNKGWLIALAIIGGVVVTSRVLPFLSRILSAVLGLGVVGIIALVALVIFFSLKAKDKDPDPSQQKKTYDPRHSTNYRSAGEEAGTSYGQTNYGRSAQGQSQEQNAPKTAPSGKETQSAAEPKAIPPSDLSPEARQILNKGRDHLKELRRLLQRIGNLNVKKRGEDICAESEKILLALQQQPEDIPMVRQFFNYYLPTLGNILLKYLRLEEAGMATEQTTVKVMTCLGEIKTAMEKQHAAIFENDLLDLTVEMEALTSACKRDGLLVSEDFTIYENGRKISLTI